jgi:chromosome segregation ATPase
MEMAMSRSIAIGAALLCALGGSAAAGGNPLGDVDVRVQFGSFGRDSGERALAHAEQRLRAAEHAYADARRTLDGLLARQAALRAELSAVERKIVECRRTGNELELRRLEGRLADVHRDTSAIEGEISRFRNLAADAGRAAEAARNEYLRQAEYSPAIRSARDHIDLAGQELDFARHRALDVVRGSFEWQREAGWREDISRRLADAERYNAGRYQVESLKRDLAESERRLEAMEQGAFARDSAVREAEARVAAAQRAYDEAWACVERDLAHDRAYAGAVADQHRFEREAARADQALCDARELIARLEQDIHQLRGSHYIADTRHLEEDAARLRFGLDRLAGDLRSADECIRRAEFEVRAARRDYEIALAACRPRYDERPGHGGGYDRPASGREEHRGSAYREDDGDRGGTKRDDDRNRGGAKRDDDRDRGGAKREDDRKEERGGNSGTYRDRGERYERARGDDDRRRTRD